ncbi:MAG: TonB-dependent receptor [Bacteroidales bacterium]|nr:TonB-dependent receptor [Bacteroidales bacterium]
MRNRIQPMASRLTMVATLTLFSATSAFAQIVVKGVVKDAFGEPVPGATARIQGTTNGTITDIDGNFALTNVPDDAVIEFSYVGYTSQQMKAQETMSITLLEDNKMLDDVVVVGYGVQKKSVVTAAIAKVGADDLAGTSPVRVDNALKGLAAGINVTSASGQPGAASKIRIRGTGSVNNSDPLYIIDGMAIEGGFDFLNPSDIESIEVLKDAASGAIYGARAANGVILVTTKKGKKGKATVNYNFSHGWQTAWTHRDVLNASEYMVMRNEGLVNSGASPIYNDPYNVTVDTDWQDLMFNDNAPVTNHELNVSGANDVVNYFLSAGYYNQEGIVGGNYGQSNYERMTLRSNLNATLFDVSKERNWLNKLEISSNVSYARVKSSGIDVNSQWGSVLSSALSLPPIITPFLEGEAAQKQIDEYSAAYPDEYRPLYIGGKLLNIPGAGFNEMANPLSMFALPAAKNWSHKFVANWRATIQLWDGLKFSTSYGADLSFWGNDSYQIPHFIAPAGKHASYSKVSAESDRGTVWQLENVLTYDKEFDKHTVNVVLGQSAFENSGWTLGASRNNIKDFNKPWINGSTGIAADGDRDGWGGPNVKHTLSSLFARLSYNYDERYMLQATVRRDGSSRFGPNNKYGVFPSFSLGWNVMNEAFMENTRDWLDNLKVRFSWGKNGSDAIGDFRYTVLTQGGNNYGFGAGGIEHELISSKANGLANPDLKWEESEQTDLGIDLGFFNNSLTVTLDYFKKATNGMLKDMNIPSYVGETKPVGNVGDMENRGFEIELGYKWKVADAQFGIKANASYIKNELIKLGNAAGFEMYDNVQNLGNVSRAEAGQPFPYFYGLKTDGIFQNMAEVEAYTNAQGQMIQPDAKPGYVRFVDTNGDGQITDDDRTKIGKGTPDWSFGMTFNAAWKGIDFMMFWQGTQGNDIFDATRRLDLNAINLPGWMLGRWTGEGTSNKYPIYILGDATNWKCSDLYIHDGSYVRLKNIELGYTIPQNITKKAFISRLRAYVAAENLLTFTKYYGYDPEISSAGTSSGMDFGVYPQPRTFKVGVNVTF